MKYEVLVLDLDGTLTNSQKKITPLTKQALFEIQEAGKKVVLASGRPTQGVVPLAKELELARFGGYILSYNGGQIIDCSTNQLIYNKQFPMDSIAPIYDIVKNYDVDLISYEGDVVISGIKQNEYTLLECKINSIPVKSVENFPTYVDFPVNKLLVTGEGSIVAEVEIELKKRFHKYLNIYRSEPFFLEIMPQNIDKAYSLQKLLNSIGHVAEEMICCGDGYNDLSMIESAGLGVAMQNAQPLVLEKADYITKSNDEDGILQVINEFLR